VAGKTGTAEVPPFQPFSWFAAMAPVQHPRFVVVSLVEQGGHGSDTSAPIVRRILEGLFGQALTGNTHTSTQKD
jgi:penicillin-binding protein 2